MENSNLESKQGGWSHGSTSINFSIQVIFYQEEGVYFAHCPALEIIGYGNTEEEAKKSFEIMLEEFLDYAVKKGTLREVLESLGWKVEKEKMTPPQLYDIAKKNKEVRELINKKSMVTKFREFAY